MSNHHLAVLAKLNWEQQDHALCARKLLSTWTAAFCVEFSDVCSHTSALGSELDTQRCIDCQPYKKFVHARDIYRESLLGKTCYKKEQSSTIFFGAIESWTHFPEMASTDLGGRLTLLWWLLFSPSAMYLENGLDAAEKRVCLNFFTR